MTAHDTDPMELVAHPACPVSQDRVPSASSREGQAGVCRIQQACTAVTFTQVNPEDKGALAKLMVAIRTNYNDRYGEVHVTGGGATL